MGKNPDTHKKIPGIKKGPRFREPFSSSNLVLGTSTFVPRTSNSVLLYTSPCTVTATTSLQLPEISSLSK